MLTESEYKPTTSLPAKLAGSHLGFVVAVTGSMAHLPGLVYMSVHGPKRTCPRA